MFGRDSKPGLCAIAKLSGDEGRQNRAEVTTGQIVIQAGVGRERHQNGLGRLGARRVMVTEMGMADVCEEAAEFDRIKRNEELLRDDRGHGREY